MPLLLESSSGIRLLESGDIRLLESDVAPVIPAGPISDAIAGMTALVANSPCFQSWVGAASASAAASHIFAAEAGYPVASITVASGILTVQMRETHLINIGQTVTLAGAAVGAESAVPVAGVYTVLAVTANTFTASIAAADASQTYADYAFVLPCARPIAIVSIADDGALGGQASASGAGMNQTGKLDVMIEADTSSGYTNDPLNAVTEANNATGLLIKSMQAINDTGLAVFTDGEGNSLEFVASSIQLTVSPKFTAREEQDNSAIRFERWRALIEVTWGINS
jgi:hypothetical protein